MVSTDKLLIIWSWATKANDVRDTSADPGARPETVVGD